MLSSSVGGSTALPLPLISGRTGNRGVPTSCPGGGDISSNTHLLSRTWPHLRPHNLLSLTSSGSVISAVSRSGSKQRAQTNVTLEIALDSVSSSSTIGSSKVADGASTGGSKSWVKPGGG